MTAAEFVQKRQQDWDELERLLAISTKKRRVQGSPLEISRFAALFRNACADLARARALGFPDELVDYLNVLTARSHNLFYVAPPFPLWRIGFFFTVLFPLAIRRNAIYVAAGLMLFFGPLLGMVALTSYNEEIVYYIVPKETLQQFEKMYEPGHSRGRREDTDAFMTGFYVRNNIGIAFQCFASGIFFGLGSILMLLLNGITIGAVFGFVSHTPSAMNLLSFGVGHGPFELTAISIAGAAGLRLGLGPILTANRRRLDSLRLAARDAVQLVLGSATLLGAAALVEGFFSPSSLPMAIKFSLGVLCALFLVWYLAIYRPSPLVEPQR